MISMIQPRVLSWEGLTVPADFPYLAAIFQGPPRHDHDEFSLRHPRMDTGKRAKIFAPFDALDGYSDAVKSKDVEYVERIELSEGDRDELNRRLAILHELTFSRRLARQNKVVVTVTYFVPCEDEDSFSFGLLGLYKAVTGVCWEVEPVRRTMTVGEIIIPLDDAFGIEADGVFEIAGMGR